MANAVTEMITSGVYTNIELWAAGLAGVEDFERASMRLGLLPFTPHWPRRSGLKATI